MNFTLMVNGSPYHSLGAASAYHFAVAALEKGHRVMRVFFYGDGVYNGLSGARVPADEASYLERWQHLARNHDVDLVLCSAAAERRGLLGGLDGEVGAFPRVAEGFRVAGLGLWMDACLGSDRVITFQG